MPTSRIKGRHRSLYFSVEGATKIGSFSRVVNFSHKPDATIEKSDFLGEDASDGDLEINGHDVNWMIHQEDAKAIEYWEGVVRKYGARIRLPSLQMVVITTFLNPAIPVKTQTFSEGVVKLDEDAASGRKDWLQATFSGFFKRMK